VKVARPETVAAAAPQQRKALPAELREERRKVRDDQRGEAGSGAGLDIGNFGADGLRRGGVARESPGEPGNLAVALHALCFHRLNPLAGFAVDHSRQSGAGKELSMKTL
jgi:hypothetical protein